MATPTREAIETFMSITGASESLALRKLEEYGGNLNQAVSAHFLEVERSITNSALPVSPRYNPADMDNRSGGRRGGILPLLSSVRSFRPSLLFNPNYRRNLFNQIGASSLNNRTTFSNVGDMRGTAVEYNSGNEDHHFEPRHPTEVSSGTSSYYGTGINQNALQNSDSHLNNNDVESEMMQAAIEASKRDFEDAYLRRQYGSSNESFGVGVQQRWDHEEEEEEDELAHALSLSLKTAEEERAIRERTMEGEYEQLGIHVSSRRTETTSGHSKAGSSSIQHLGPDTHDNLQNSKDAFYSNEWGGISSKELDEAIMLETQLFSQIPKGSSYGSTQRTHKPSDPDRTVGPRPEAASNLSSSTIMEQRLLREQQDNEYLASLLADRKKEMNVQKEAETRSLKEEGSKMKRAEGERVQRVMAAKEVSLPKEPAIDDENAVTLLVRMPDGSRHARRFLKSDKLQLLFDFIDVGKLMKSGTYRVVRPYPRHAFSVDDGTSSLNELGLTSKQEALFLELL
ncbi:hypothetical protein SLEP1_g24134 [Rubroshorea leprosula]|uniref:UBX domain-containing protein n=2 Tax=Rubroshorea leprosula TaxID=152421 RepID=A0AAV5JRR4_9ROSI|nr:hypothetical protein SLEP1_g24134 [Rubroshorea leprosula]